MPNLNVRISKEQEDFIKKKAEINNMNISEYVKSCLFNKNENKQVKINNEENKNNLDDINNKILKVNTNVIKSHNILDNNLLYSSRTWIWFAPGTRYNFRPTAG